MISNPTDADAYSVPTCMIKMTTGLDCPGCGGTRALCYVLHGDLPAAARHHVLVVFALPFLAWLFVAWAGAEPFGRPARATHHARRIGVFLAAWMAFTMRATCPGPPSPGSTSSRGAVRRPAARRCDRSPPRPARRRRAAVRRATSTVPPDAPPSERRSVAAVDDAGARVERADARRAETADRERRSARVRCSSVLWTVIRSTTSAGPSGATPMIDSAVQETGPSTRRG